MNINDPYVAWEQLNTSYGTPGAAAIFVEFKEVTQMQICDDQDPGQVIGKMQSTFTYLAANGLTLPDSARAMILLSALPKNWGGFASTLLATLLVVLPAGTAVGLPVLTFDTVLPKIHKEWSWKSNWSVMPKDDKIL